MTGKLTEGLHVSFLVAPVENELQSGTEYTVTRVSTHDNQVQLRDSVGREYWWSPEAAEAASVRISRLASMRVAVGCRLQITSNLRPQKLVNGDAVTIERILGKGAQILVRTSDQRQIWLDLNNPDHQFLRIGYALTAHAAQGRTVDRVLAHLPSDSTLSNQRTTYVCISRARQEARVFTDSLEKLNGALRYNSGENAMAMVPDFERQIDSTCRSGKLARYLSKLENENSERVELRQNAYQLNIDESI